MLQNSGSMIPIEEKQLGDFTTKANGYLKALKYLPKTQAKARKNSVDPTPAFMESEQKVLKKDFSVLKTAIQIGKDSLLFPEGINHVLCTVRQGLRIGMHISALYGKASGLDTLQAINSKGGLVSTQKVEFANKTETASVVAIFTAAYYIVWELSRYRADEVSAVNMDFDGIPETNLSSPVDAITCMLYYYCDKLENSGNVNTEIDFIKMTIMYFRGIVDEIKTREGSLKFVDAFTSKSYKLVESEFSLNGFDASMNDGVVSVEFNRLKFNEIVGNRDAKREGLRLAYGLLCYDSESKRNPLMDLGGFSHIRCGFGKPGTGKGMQISSTATILDERSLEYTGLPFFYHPMPEDLVSTFQGGSAEKTKVWFKPLRDPNKIVYAPIDDGEQKLEERTRQGVSAGVREVIATYLPNVEGASAVWRGNSAIEIFTNLLDMVDKAVLSRIMHRYTIDGSITWEDFIDQDYLWQEKRYGIKSDFINMKDPEGYRYLDAQKIVARILGNKNITEAKNQIVNEIIDKARRKYKFNEQAYFAEIYITFQKQFPIFSSRDVRNIQKAIDTRVMDFDFPEEWLNKPSLFFRQNYEIKMKMLKNLREENMQGLSFAQIREQEVIRYLDILIEITDKGKERAIAEAMERKMVNHEADKRLSEQI